MDTTQLKRIPLFADASDEELKRVATFAEAREVDEGTEVISEGGFSRELLAIEDGTAEVTRDGEHLADLGPGDSSARPACSTTTCEAPRSSRPRA